MAPGERAEGSQDTRTRARKRQAVIERTAVERERESMSYRDSPRGDRYDDRARYDDRERDYGRRDPDERPPPRRSYRDYDDSSR